MSLRDEFYGDDENGGRARLGSKGPCWNGKAKGDFVRGRVESAQVKMGSKLNGEPTRKMVLVLTNAVGHITTESEDGDRVGQRFATTGEAPHVSVVADGPRGAALAQALDDAREACGADGWVQVRYIGEARQAEKGKARAKYWEVKVWASEPAPGVKPVVALDMSAERSERVPLAVPETAVAL